MFRVRPARLLVAVGVLLAVLALTRVLTSNQSADRVWGGLLLLCGTAIVASGLFEEPTRREPYRESAEPGEATAETNPHDATTSVVRVMTSRGLQWVRTLTAILFGAGFVLGLGGQRSGILGPLLPLMVGVSAVISIFVAVLAWTSPQAIFSGQGVTFPPRKMVPWSAVEAVSLGGTSGWPQTPEVVMHTGKRFTFPTADLAVLADVELLVPEGVQLRPTRGLPE